MGGLESKETVSTHVMTNGFRNITGIRPACRKDLADIINFKLTRAPVVAVPNLSTTWALIVITLVCLSARITISFFAFPRLQIADGLALLAFALFVSDGVCPHLLAAFIVLARFRSFINLRPGNYCS